jgi:hypothetical protein
VTVPRIIEAARNYLARGWEIVPIKPRSKQPRMKDWPNTHIALREVSRHFRGGDNIGLLLGAASGGLVDVDLDCSEALQLAPVFLPATARVHGRKSKPASHWWYRTAYPPEKVHRFCDADGATLVELRSTGGQTVVPPSLHESGEPMVWESEGDPAEVDARRLLQAVARLAAAALLRRSWPPRGSRHDTALALAGLLLRFGFAQDDAAHFIEIVATAAGDEEARQRALDVLSTATRLLGGLKTTGGKSLSEIIGADVVRRVCDFFRIAQPKSPAVQSREHGQVTSKTPDAGPYRVKNGEICVEQMKPHGPVHTPLCNFVARVDEELILDDGVEINRAFSISGKLALGGRLPPIHVPAPRFGSMSWVSEQWGFGAIVNAGSSTRDRLREAIQRLSPTPKLRRVFMHTGWRELDGEWVYLTAGGAVGREGFDVDLGAELSRYSLPRAPENSREAMAYSLKLLGLAPLTVTVPLFAAIYRAPLATACPLDLSLWLEGQTGSLKSTIASLFLSHFGSFSETSLPGAWSSTANQLERRAFVLKDMPFVVDDYAPCGMDARELELKASRLLRSQGNLSGRGRLRADLTERAAYPPRGIIIGTGEQHPSGQSILARTMLIELDRSRVNLAALSEAQRARSILPNAMAGYVLWLMPQMDKLPGLLRQAFDQTRGTGVFADQHLRIPASFAHLWIGIDCALSYATEIGSISKSEADAVRSQSSNALREVALRQAQSVEGESPSRRFLSVLATMLTQGRVVLFARELDPTSHSGNAEIVGWCDDEFIYLMPEAAFNSVARFCRETGEFFPIRSERLLRDFSKEGYSDCVEGRNTAVVTLGGRKRRVVRLRRDRVEELLGEALSFSDLTSRTAETGSGR